MKLLLDENLPKRLKLDFPEFEIFTVTDMGWNGKKNGELLQLLVEHRFDALLTFDRNMRHQQNFNKYTLAVLVLNAPDNTYQTLRQLTSQIKKLLGSDLPKGPVEIRASNESEK